MEDREKGLTREQRLEVEDNAIQALLQMGCKFSVPLKLEPAKPSRWYRLLKRVFPKRQKAWRDKRLPKGWDVSLTTIPDVELGETKEVYMRRFSVKPLYLGTIDRLRKLYIEIEYDEKTIQEQPLQESKRLFKYIGQMCRIAAVAVLNNPSVADTNDKEVARLADFFKEHLTVARLQRLTAVVAQMMNPAGFTASIRLMGGVGTTKPTPGPEARRIE